MGRTRREPCTTVGRSPRPSQHHHLVWVALLESPAPDGTLGSKTDAASDARQGALPGHGSEPLGRQMGPSAELAVARAGEASTRLSCATCGHQ